VIRPVVTSDETNRLAIKRFNAAFAQPLADAAGAAGQVDYVLDG